MLPAKLFGRRDSRPAGPRDRNFIDAASRGMAEIDNAQAVRRDGELGYHHVRATVVERTKQHVAGEWQ